MTLFDLAVYALNVAVVVACAYLAWLEYRANHFATFFWVTLLTIYAVPAFADPAETAAPVVGTSTVIFLAGDVALLQAPLFALLFAVFYAVVRLATLRHWTQPSILEDLSSNLEHDGTAKRLAMLLACAAVAGALLGAYAVYHVAGVRGLLESGYSFFRLNADPTYSRPAYFLLAAASGGVFLSWRTKNWLPVGAIVASVVAYFLLSFARQILIFMLAPFAIWAMYGKRTFTARVGLVIAAVGAYYFMIFLCLLRYRGSNVDALEALFTGDLFTDFDESMAKEGGEAQLRYVYYFFIKHPEATAAVMPGQTYLRLLMLPLPAEYSFGVKPELTDMSLWTAFYTAPGYRNVVGGSLHALVFGDAYVNFGWSGAFLGAFWAIAAHVSALALRWLPKVVRLCLYAPLIFAAMGVARGSIYNSCAYAFWSGLIIVSLYMLSSLRLGDRVRATAS